MVVLAHWWGVLSVQNTWLGSIRSKKNKREMDKIDYSIGILNF